MRIEPDAHRIFGGKGLDVADPVYAPELVEHAGVGEIVDLHRVGVAALRRDRDDQQEARIGLGHRNALAADVLGQALLDAAQAVLHLHLRIVDVGPRLEGQGDRGGAIRFAGRGHIEEALDPVQFLLDDLRDILFERARVGARIGDADRQRRRRDRRILLYGQAAQRDDPGQQDADGDDPGEDGPVDEKAGGHVRSALRRGG